MDTRTRPPRTQRNAARKQRQPSRVQRMVSSIGRPCWFAAKCVLPLLILALLGISVLYVRLLNGPISLQFLAAPISRSIAAELPGVNVAIEDALIRLTDGGSIEVRMKNVRFTDLDNAPIAVAPLAAVGMSTAALWSGRIAPDKVVLIEPRLLLVYNENGGLSVSFAKPGAAKEAASTSSPPETRQPPASISPLIDEEIAGGLRQIDIARLITEAGQRARRGTGASSFLREIGVRNATVVLDRSGRQTFWTVIEGDIDLEHKKRRSTMTGNVSMASPSGPWSLAFKIEEAEKAGTVSLEASVRDAVPKAIAPMLPEIPLLETLDTPVSGQARLDLDAGSKVTGGTLLLDLGSGVLQLPNLEKHSLPIDGGHLSIRFDARAKRIELEPSTLQWGQGRVTMSGVATAATGADGSTNWDMDFKSTEGRLSAEEFSVPPIAIDELSLKGTFLGSTGILALRQVLLRAAGTQVETSGELSTSLGRRAIRLDGRIGAMPAAVAKAIWPRLLGPGARRWAGRQVTKGRLVGGTFKVAMAEQGGELLSARTAERISLSIEVADGAFIPAKTLVPVEFPRALIRIEGEGLEVSIPDASTQVAAGRRIVLKGGRLTAVDIYGERTQGEIAFRVQAPLAAAVDYLEQDTVGIGSLGMPSEGLDGKVEGQFKLALPLVTGVELSDVKIDGKLKITDGRAKQAIGPHDIHAATISVDIGDGAVNASGQMLVGGVSSKLSFQRIIGAPEDKQPPLRLTATLDAADRAQLGLDINHIVHGEIPVDLTVTSGPRSEQLIRVRADLSGADLSLEPVSWRKAPGRQAILQFDVAKGNRQKTELLNFKVVGDDIAIDGWMALDAKGRLTEFHFPDFSLTLVSRLELQGVLRPDNVWDVKANGQYWDGRDFFRSLYAVGAAGDKQPPKKDQPGLDLKADIESVQGHSDVSLKGLRLQLSRRNGRLSGLIARSGVTGGRPVEIGLQQVANEPRKLVALTDDGGQVFRLVGFYPNLNGGQMRLEVNLDGKGPAEKTGLLMVERFRILGDPIVSEVLQTSDDGTRTNVEAGNRVTRRVERETTEFEWMRAPFSLGYNQFVLDDAELRGPLLGARLRGKADFKSQTVDIGGTYVPLQGLNAAVGGIPLFGQLLAGSKGEGVLGITFRIVGPMAQPQVVVNPLSMIAPGMIRELFQMTTQNPRVIPRDERPAAVVKQKVQPGPAGGDVVRQPAKAPRAAVPEVSGGWSAGVSTSKN